MIKTNVMRLLEQHKIAYTAHEWEHADQINSSNAPVYKTLVTVGKTLDHYVFVVPISSELDLKKAANAVGEKKMHMLKERELEPLTGYVHGGCSPIGMKKNFHTTIDASALAYETILFSAGKVGKSVELDPRSVDDIISVDFKDVKTDD